VGNDSGSGQAKIGEVALASSGILFFDEIPHFSKNILEAMREPLQDRKGSKVSHRKQFRKIACMP